MASRRFEMYQLLDLFSGIGGFSLGLERSGGFQTVAFCEIDPFCHKVLAKHWPGVPIYNDVKTLTKSRLDADGISIDAICGGFPCQDVSTVGSRIGIEGERSGLWDQYARIIREIRPRLAVVENVTGLLHRGIADVLGDLADCGYDAEWSVLSACALGAPHSRERVFLVAYPNEQRSQASGTERSGNGVAAYARPFNPEHVHQIAVSVSRSLRETFSSEPALDRVADGVPDRIPALRGLGNSIFPPIPELIGRAILAAESI